MQTDPAPLWDHHRVAEIHQHKLRLQGECLFEAALAVVREEYGASEFASIAAECAAGRLHVNADWVVLEPVDAAFEPVKPGETSHTVLLTNLANRVQPLIRYDLGDSVKIGTIPCACGVPLPTITVQGRADDLLELPARAGGCVRLAPLVLTTILEEGAGLWDFQLEQTGPAAVRLHVGTPGPGVAERATTVLGNYFADQGIAEVRIDVDEMPPRREGQGAKLRRVLTAPGTRPGPGPCYIAQDVGH